MDVRLGNQQRHSITAVLLSTVVIVFGLAILDMRQGDDPDPLLNITEASESTTSTSFELADDDRSSARNSARFTLSPEVTRTESTLDDPSSTTAQRTVATSDPAVTTTTESTVTDGTPTAVPTTSTSLQITLPTVITRPRQTTSTIDDGRSSTARKCRGNGRKCRDND